MTSMLIASFPLPCSPPPHLHPQAKSLARFPPSSPTHCRASIVDLSLSLRRTGRRGEAVVARAGGPPSTTTLIIVFVLPLSLLVGTILASIRIADSLDEQYLEELAMNKAVMEEKELGEEEEDNEEEEEEEVAPAAVVPRARNRPKREV